MTENPNYVPVKGILDGGEGVPVPCYRGTYKGEGINWWGQGQARQALDWLSNKHSGFAIYSVIDGEEREVARGSAALV